MGTGIFYPATNDDDGFVENGIVRAAGYDSGWFGERFGSIAHFFVRFENVAIPRGATIVTAYIRMRAANTDSGTGCHINIYGNDIGDATAPGSEYNALALTDALVEWNPEAFSWGSWYNSPELKTILQEIVDRSDFEDGSSVLLTGKNDSSADERFMYFYDKGSGYYPELHVEWSPNDLIGSVVIDSPPNVRELINRIAYEASSVESWDAGKHNIVYLPTHTTVTKTLDANRIDKDSVSIYYTDRVDLLNDLTLWYDYYWSGYSGDDAFRATVGDSDSASIADYGDLKGEPFQFKYLKGEQNAERALRWILTQIKQPSLVIELSGGFYLTDIRRSNLINFDFDTDDELDKAFSGLVSTTDKFMITNIVRSIGSIKIKAVLLRELT